MAVPGFTSAAPGFLDINETIAAMAARRFESAAKISQQAYTFAAKMAKDPDVKEDVEVFYSVAKLARATFKTRSCPTIDNFKDMAEQGQAVVNATVARAVGHLNREIAKSNQTERIQLPDASLGQSLPGIDSRTHVQAIELISERSSQGVRATIEAALRAERGKAQVEFAVEQDRTREKQDRAKEKLIGEIMERRAIEPSEKGGIGTGRALQLGRGIDQKGGGSGLAVGSGSRGVPGCASLLLGSTAGMSRPGVAGTKAAIGSISLSGGTSSKGGAGASGSAGRGPGTGAGQGSAVGMGAGTGGGGHGKSGGFGHGRVLP